MFPYAKPKHSSSVIFISEPIRLNDLSDILSGTSCERSTCEFFPKMVRWLS
jgi:hypothetical protein